MCEAVSNVCEAVTYVCDDVCSCVCVGGLGFDFCVFIAALRSEWPLLLLLMCVRLCVALDRVLEVVRAVWRVGGCRIYQ